MTTLLDAIHACNDHERELFGAEQKPFSNTLARWHSDLRPSQENNNFFYPLAGLSADDLREAIALQKSRGLDYLMLRTSSPCPSPCKRNLSWKRTSPISWP